VIVARRLTSKAAKLFRLFRAVGPRAFLARVFLKFSNSLAPLMKPMLVSVEDAEAVDWSEPAPWSHDPLVVTGRPLSLAWIMSPPSPTSGGHQNLFRFIDFAEKAGHACTIYLYDNQGIDLSVSDASRMIQQSPAYEHVKADILIYDRVNGVREGTDAIFATGWETAYPAFSDPSLARRLYFVQDFEAGFYPLGTESLLAENTYRFGFHGITAGNWLATKLRTEYGMSTDHFDFAVDKTHYSVTNFERRNEIFFYARPVTPRRAFEFGVLALEQFAEMRPDVTINLGGWDVEKWHIPFRYTNLTAMDITQLNAVYNRCAAGLVLSLSNMSLLPLELMSSGVAPVVNDAPNNRLVSDNPFIEYILPSPRAIAKRLVEVLERPDAVERSIAMSESVVNVNWEDSGRQFVTALERAMRG
jgi:hypothetical protein